MTLDDAIARAESPRDLLIIGKRAAERIRELEAERDRLKLYRDEAAVLSGEVGRLQLDLARMTDAFGLARRRADAAEAELAQLKQPAHVLAEAERLLREADVSRVAFSRKRGLNVTVEQFGTLSDLNLDRYPTTSEDDLSLAYAKLTGGRDG